MKWTTKARIQRTLQHVPAGRAVYYLGQRWVGNFRRFSVNHKVEQGVSFIERLNALGADIAGWHTLEIGTGWTPIVPLVFWANGQAACDTFDVSLLLRPGLVARTIEQLAANPAAAVPPSATPERAHAVTERLSYLQGAAALLHDINRILESCEIRYHPCMDASHSGLPEGSVDLVFSNVVLEHVDVEAVHRLFDEARRILRPNGYMAHLIDTSDHFAHGDPALTSINFLRFSDDQFARYNSTFLYQNRLRASAWRRLFEQHKFVISHWDAVIDHQAAARIETLPIAAAFRDLPAEDLCTTAIWVLARRPP